LPVSGLSGVTAIAAGGAFSLALKSNGSVWAWGWNVEGELGIGSTGNSATPVQVGNLAGVTAIAAGGYHSLALKSDGTVWGWGNSFFGELGAGAISAAGCNCVSTPVQVSDL